MEAFWTLSKLFPNILYAQNTDMPMCTLKELLITVIIPPVHTGKEEIHSLSDYNMSEGEQNLQSSFCTKMHSKVQLKLICGLSRLS